MTLPEPLAAHKSTLYLVFSPLCRPFAELLAWKHSKHSAHLQVGLDTNLLAKEPQLVIPQGPFSQKRTVLVGKSSICRYFARHQSELYNEQQLQKRAQIDQLIFKLGQGLPVDQVKKEVAESLNGPVDLAHCFAWDYSLQHPQVFEKADSEEKKEIQTKIEQIIRNAPLLSQYKYNIAAQVEKITGVDAQIPYNFLMEARDKKLGDLQLAVPALKLQGPPPQVAKDIAAKIEQNEFIESAVGQGVFVNFKLNKQKLYHETVRQAILLDTKYGTNASGFGNLAVVEFSSPNIAKPFHAGHLRSTIIGSFISNILQANGWTTYKINYLGDWGKQYGLLAVGYSKYGSEEELARDPIKHLFDVYVKINEEAREDPDVHETARKYFKKMEDGDEEAYGLWKRFRDLSIVKYKQIYERLNISFDLFSGESQYSLSQMQDVMDELHDKNLLVTLDGAQVVDLKPWDIGTAVIGKSDGSLLYLSRDIAAAQDRKKNYGFDEMYYVVASQQDHHFKQLFKILELLGKTWYQTCFHINFGMIEGMSTRKGNVVFLEDILDQTKEEMHNVMKKNEQKYAQIEDPEYVSDIVGMSSIMIQDMSARRIKDYTFDMQRMLSFEGDTGPYLQYAHARLCSIERGYHKQVNASNIQSIDLDLLKEEKAQLLMQQIGLYPDVVKEAAKSKEPTAIVKYCLALSHKVSSAVTDLYVQNQPEEIALARLAMFTAARMTLGNGLRLLNLIPLERM
ncbi:hypothetical protein EDD86DRAFT_213251 [Gorgonomyces haynaldii]|nr:hypothetical protein EDD86DRAFT_213251 [Gorgonomyces haynaldii]